MSPRRRKIIYTMIVVAFGLLIMTIGVVIGMNLKNNTKAPINEDNNQEIDVGEPNPNIPDNDFNINDPMPDALDSGIEFESSRYNIKFIYSETFGEHKVTVNTGYFFNEDVSFPKSNIKIGYTRYEGSAGMDGNNIAEGEVNTKQGYTGSYYIFPNSTGYTLFVRVPSPGSNGNGVVVTSAASTQVGAEAELIKVQEILNTIEFDFSSVPMGGCETSCK